MRTSLKTILLAATFSLTALAPAWAAKTLYFGLSVEPSTLEASVQAGTAARTVRLAIHRGLLNYGVDGKLSPELAQSYSVSPDGKEYTFVLRKASFHDGEPVTAEDVKATFAWLLGLSSRATYKGELGVIDSIEVVDPQTVRFHLKNAFVPFPHYLALAESAILPKAWLEKNGTNPNAAPVGAGPFQFVTWSRGREIVVKKFPGYYKAGKPGVDELHFQFTTDDDTRVNAIRTGDVDIIEYVPWKDLPTLKKDKNIRIESTSGPFMMLQFNTHFEPFSKPEVRQAISYAINRAVVIDTAFNGAGTPLFSLPFVKGAPGYNPALENYFSYNPAKAKELLAKAGYPNGFKARLLATAQYGYHMNTAIAVKSELAKVGIDADLDLPDWAGRMAKNNAGNYDFIVAGTAGDITDPDWLSNFYYGGKQLVRMNNSPYFDDPEINRLLDAGRVTLDEAARTKVYDEFSKRALELSPFVYIMWRDQSYAVRSNVSGFTNLPGFLSFQSGYSLENVTLK